MKSSSSQKSETLIWISKEVTVDLSTTHSMSSSCPSFTPLQPLRHWLDTIVISDREMAHRICQLIPARCPFERTIKVFGYTLLRVPPLCKLNPVYEELVALRFRALCYLADQCSEDVSSYC